MALAISSSGCAASAQTKVGAVLFFAGLGGLTGGVTVAVDHCSPSPDFCRSTVPARADVGIPIIAAGSLALIAGGALMLTAKGPATAPTTAVHVSPPPAAPQQPGDRPPPLF